MPAEDFDEHQKATLTFDVKARERLSTTFRFQTGSAALESKALADIARLRDLLAGGLYKGKSVILAGFADNVGSFRSNLNLSEARAREVQKALGDLCNDSPNVVVRGDSGLAPTGCNDTDAAHQFNRRVEVWLGK